MSQQKASKLAVFEGKRIRKVLHEGEWWFSIIDVIEALVGGDRPRKYWNDLKKKLLQEGYEQLSEKIGQLTIETYEKIVRLTMTVADGRQHFAGSDNTNRRHPA
jgi:DNA-damage-inducible protein D